MMQNFIFVIFLNNVNHFFRLDSFEFLGFNIFKYMNQ